MRRVLFVCTANRCRSPLAEGILKHLLETEYAATSLADVEVASAGVQAILGSPALPESVQVAAEHGIDLAEHASQPVSRELIEAFDYILAMEPAHLRTMSFYSSQAKMKSTLLKSFIEKNPKKQTIKDPVGQPLRLHRDCYKELERSIRGFIKFLADGR